MEDKKLKLREQLEYKKGLKWHSLPYVEIVQAYLRIEEVRGRLCCGVANFDMNFLMLKTKEGELIKVEFFSKERVKQALEELKEKNQEIVVGYHKEKDGGKP